MSVSLDADKIHGDNKNWIIGRHQITQELFGPRGSTFEFLSAVTEEFGGRGRAPDAVPYMSAGIAFCFKTQLGRYAKIKKKTWSGTM